MYSEGSMYISGAFTYRIHLVWQALFSAVWLLNRTLGCSGILIKLVPSNPFHPYYNVKLTEKV